MDEHGGAPKVYARMASYWADVCGYDVTMLVHYGSTNSTYDISPKVKIKSAMPTVEKPNRYVRSLLSPILLKELYREIKREKPDIVILNNAPYYALTFGATVCMARKVPFVIWNHDGFFMRSTPMYKIARKLFFPKANAVILLTNGDKDHLGHLNSNTHIIKNPADDIDLVAERTLANNNIALFVGRFVPQKSLSNLLHAWKKAALAGWKLQLVGDGIERTMLEELAATLGITDSVVFLGERTDTATFYRNASFFVMSSKHEGLPVVCIEALAHGLPLVLYDAPYWAAELVDDNKNGFLAECGDTSTLAAAMQKMASSHEMRVQFSAHSLQKVTAFAIDEVSNRWEEIFKQVKTSSMRT
jgi:glycosyltransferase involved in cell wall biosynthesis